MDPSGALGLTVRHSPVSSAASGSSFCPPFRSASTFANTMTGENADIAGEDNAKKAASFVYSRVVIIGCARWS